ncbi:MAG: cysteine--tRNA ligase, partial [Planctomycetota bacterium]
GGAPARERGLSPLELLRRVEAGERQPIRRARADGPSDDEIDALLAKREAARREKDFATADQIRNELDAAGVAIEDGPGGASWRRK